MAGNTIKHNDINDIKENIKKSQDTLTVIKNNITSTTGLLKGSWQGKDSERFTTKMTEDYTFLLGKFNDVLTEYIDFLDSAKEAYDKHDNDYLAKAIVIDEG